MLACQDFFNPDTAIFPLDKDSCFKNNIYARSWKAEKDDVTIFKVL
jgi:hypothetical protein